MNLRDLQEESAKWREANFEPQHRGKLHQMLGVMEEVGELSHSILKQSQGIRGTWASHQADAEDAVGDILIYLCGLCTAMGIDLEVATTRAWSEVRNRDWKENPEDGQVDERSTGQRREDLRGQSRVLSQSGRGDEDLSSRDAPGTKTR